MDSKDALLELAGWESPYSFLPRFIRRRIESPPWPVFIKNGYLSLGKRGSPVYTVDDAKDIDECKRLLAGRDFYAFSNNVHIESVEPPSLPGSDGLSLDCRLGKNTFRAEYASSPLISEKDVYILLYVRQDLNATISIGSRL